MVSKEIPLILDGSLTPPSSYRVILRLSQKALQNNIDILPMFHVFFGYVVIQELMLIPLQKEWREEMLVLIRLMELPLQMMVQMLE